MDNKKKKILWILILVFSIIIVSASIGLLVYHYYFDTVDDLPGRIQSTASDIAPQPAPKDTGNSAQNTQPATQSATMTHRYQDKTEKLPKENSVNFKDLIKINPDIYAWIYIPNTNVDLPVAQSAPGEDDGFYLNHNVYKNYQFAGTIYSEKHNKLDFSDPVTLLYGHNMLNGTMFASLHNFNDKNFFNKNNTIFIFTKDKILTYLVYAAYQYDDRHILNSFDMEDPQSLKEYQKSTLQKRPYYCNVRDGISLDENDKILTLSTCMDGGGNVRYLVQGVLVNEQPAV